MAGCCANWNELSSYVKGGKFLDMLWNFSLCQEGICCMELAGLYVRIVKLSLHYVVQYGYGIAWVVKVTVKKNKLMVFERKMLKKIFGPTKETNSTWRIKTNDGLHELVGHKNIINDTKAQRLSRFAHLHRMPEEREW